MSNKIFWRVYEGFSPDISYPYFNKQQLGIVQNVIGLQNWVTRTACKSLQNLNEKLSLAHDLQYQFQLMSHVELTADEEALLCHIDVLKHCLAESREELSHVGTPDPLVQAFLLDRKDCPLFDHGLATIVYVNEENEPLLRLESSCDPSKKEESLRWIKDFLDSMGKENESVDLKRFSSALNAVESCQMKLDEFNGSRLEKEEEIKKLQKSYEEKRAVLFQKKEPLKKKQAEMDELRRDVESLEKAEKKKKACIEECDKILKDKESEIDKLSKRILRRESKLECTSDLKQKQGLAEARLERQKTEKNELDNDLLLIAEKINQKHLALSRCETEGKKQEDDLVPLQESFNAAQDQLYHALNELADQERFLELELQAAQYDVVNLLSPAHRELRFYKAALTAASSEVSAVVQARLEDLIGKQYEERGVELGNLKEKIINIQRKGDELSVVIEMAWEVIDSECLEKARCTFILQPLIGKCVPLDIAFDCRGTDTQVF